ncbi:MAG: ATP phosphoribosyltransferase regulatory subunit [Porticoccaceae bacterium]|jgi:ATP phosphoribosyltransferase regulatory subunit|nr:MAG: ATP phosphoribosyltransferase regulatory subunit [SAR92 bacterium BACL16 MAG-120619-bin48]MDO7636059.1 ATP phosphoribosyltransferase regulatory subunit [Porticoccaceae bacterium]MDP4654991.1 ATP phosphoribosyltransferase regulatory subunit [Alphaproteobacteria bacterium]MDP4745423.1 ATP phosphoribosyltransferase regulatory subunit [Porticoccaceae bacterium]MDP4753460.1 ATP phosphoribosyltransferase regulatory subunit [Porticoccaceae bacterium]
MTTADRWLLPDGVDEVLPEQAHVVEYMRRQLLDLYHNWGYDLVIPPMVEFTDSLLSGSGSDLDLMTFRITDQLSGRMMGIRADITPQTARMDAHSLRREGPSRLCYAGTVLHTRPRGPLESRTPISLGVELFGEASLAADIEVIELFLQTLATAGVEKVHLDLGHVDIFRGLLANADLSQELESELFELLQRKATRELGQWVSQNITDPKLAEWLTILPSLTGSAEILKAAKHKLAGAPAKVLQAIAQLEDVVAAISTRNITVYLDLGEMPGYHYHTGIVFAAYVQGHGKALGNGGRYDHVGAAFGRPRPATGFAFNLKSLVTQSKYSHRAGLGIFVPYTNNAQLAEQIALLRSQGNRVVQGFQGQQVDYNEVSCDRLLVEENGHLVIQKLP